MTGPGPGPEIRHILCGVDGSDPACRAAEHASWLARELNVELTFLAVALKGYDDAAIEQYKQTEGLGVEPIPLLHVQAESCLIAALARASELGFKAANRLVRIGKIAPTILSVAEEIKADTIVLGRHEHSEIRRSLIGSVSRTIAVKSHLRLFEVW